jgi:hypothetical protein
MRATSENQRTTSSVPYLDEVRPKGDTAGDAHDAPARKMSNTRSVTGCPRRRRSTVDTYRNLLP